MEQNQDPELGNLLREWRVPPHSAALEERVLGAKLPWWRFLLTGSIRVPAPVALGLAMLMTFGAWRAASVVCPASSHC